MKSRIDFDGKRNNVLGGSYLAWLCFSVYLSANYGNQIAKLFTDLPQNLKSTPPFVLSFVYLMAFVPSLVFALIIIFYFLFAIVKNGFEFRQIEKKKFTKTYRNQNKLIVLIYQAGINALLTFKL